MLTVPPLFILSNFIFHPDCFFLRCLKRCGCNLPLDSVVEQIPVSCLFPLLRPGLCVKWLIWDTAAEGTQVIHRNSWYQAENGPNVHSYCLLLPVVAMVSLSKEDIWCFILQRKVIFYRLLRQLENRPLILKSPWPCYVNIKKICRNMQLC